MTGQSVKKSSSVVITGTLMLAAAGCVSLMGLDDLRIASVVDDAAPVPPPDAASSMVDVDAAIELDATPEAPDAAVLLRSCKQLRASGVTTDGIVRIDPDGEGPVPSVDVYCEMTTDGGGWTLVARSVADSTGPFGWHVARGLVTHDAAPYGLGDAALALAFTELLVSARDGDAKALGELAYKLRITPEDLTTHESAAFTDYDISTVRGTCNPAFGPPMLRFSGYTSRATAYFFRNAAINDDYGLHPDGFSLFFGDCANGGSLHGLQGMLFVR